MSVPNEQATGRVGLKPGSAGRVLADGRRVYRLVMPQVIWWTWIGVVVLGLGDLLVEGHDWISLQFGLGLLAVTGVIFACTLWPRVIADDRGIIVHNPFRSFQIPWGGVNGIFLADSVEVQCTRRAPKNDKTVYSWALAAPRRARARAQLRGRQWDHGRRNRPSAYERLPAAAKEVVKQTPAEVMARELARMSEQTRSRPGGHGTASGVAARAGAGSGGTGAGMSANGVAADFTPDRPDVSTGLPAADVLCTRWAWQPLAAILVPAIAFTVTQLLR